MTDNIRAPIPIKNRKVSELKYSHMKTLRSSSSSDNLSSKRAKLLNATSPDAIAQQRARSATPTMGKRLFNGMDSDILLQTRLEHYDLDYVDDRAEHTRNIYDANSKWFCRDVEPKFHEEDCLPYKTETHKEQAKYLCHVMVNLYIAISSLDIQGLISISSKDLTDLKKEIDDLALNTDLFRLTNEEEGNVNDIGDFDEDEDQDAEEENEFIDISGPDFNATGKITAKSATIINVNHWTNELKNCLHFDFPITLRKSLASVYYYLSLVQGQKIYRQMHVDMFESLVNSDDEGTNFTDLLLKAGLRLDHKPMLLFLNEFLPRPESDYTRYDISSKQDIQLFQLLLKLAHHAKVFYDEDDGSILRDTMDYLVSSFSPNTLVCVLPMITSFVPYHYQPDCRITDYFPFIFGIWTSTSASVVFDTHLYDFVGCIAEDAHSKLIKEKEPRLLKYGHVKFEKFGLFTEDQINFIFNRVQNHLREDCQIHSYSRTVKPLVYSINGSSSNDFFNKMGSLIKSIETFVHPSNNGSWTKVIAKFIHGFIKMYHKRYKLEKKIEHGYRDEIKLTAQCHVKMVETFLDLLVLGSQNKNPDMANYYISSFAYLLDISPENDYLIFDRVLIDLYDSLADQYVNSTHRVISSLKQFTRTVRYMVLHPLYRVHITNIFSMLVSKIDFNDINLTSNIVNAIVSIASFIPLENFVLEDEYLTFESNTIPLIQEHLFALKDGNSSQTIKFDKDILDCAFKASTTAFQTIMKIFIDKIYQLVDVDLDEGFVTKINQTSMIMIESMSDEIFEYFENSLERKLWESDSFKDKNPNYELITIPLGAAVRRDNSLAKKLFKSLSYHIKEQIKRGAGSIRSSSEIQHRDVKLVTYLTALNDVLRQAHESLLEFSGELTELLKYVYENITNPPLDVVTSMIIHSILTSLTSVEITECRLFSADSKIPKFERWGGLQFDDRKFSSENLNFKWHVPSTAEIDFAVTLLETFTDYCVSSIETMIKEPQSDSAYSDRLKKYILVITHALSGSSLLFDPDFNKNKTEVEQLDPYKRKLLLLKSIRNNNCDNQELDIDIEQIRADSMEDSIEGFNYPDLSNEGVDEIQIKDDENDDLVIDEAIDTSEVPSGVTTPVPGHGSGVANSAINCSLAFRDLDIYTCNYCFGMSAEEKIVDSRYLKVHLIRSKIGHFFHKFFKFLTAKYEDNTNIFQILLHGLKVWFTDVGQETIFNEDPTTFLDLDFIENIQSLAHCDEPFTRTCLAVRVHSFHEARVLLRSTNRVPSKLEILLLKDIISLSMSEYPDIFKPAQGCMVHAMKQLVGSYSIIIKKTIESLKEAISNNQSMKVEVILQLLYIKKIHRKLMSDYKNLEELVFLLMDACKIKELDIAIYADRILTDISLSLKIPSSVCIFDVEKVEVLRPADNSIQLQIEAVKKAKQKKREYFLSLLTNLQNKLVGFLSTEQDLGWKIPMFIIRITSKLQTSLETKPEIAVLKQIFEFSKTKHPYAIHLALKSFLNICNKILCLGDFEYVIEKAFDSSFRRRYVETIDTSKHNSSTLFRNEMENFESSNYFLDSKAFVGWLAWGRPMEVVKPVSQVPFHLRNDDFIVLKKFGNLITKEWVEGLITILIQDNETKSAFSSANVDFFALLVHLISNGRSVLEYTDLLTLCESTYDKSDKPSMIVSVEILAGLLTASKYTDEENLGKRDEFLRRFLDSCLDHELNQDSVDIWGILCWWLPNITDIRRCPVFFRKLVQIKGLLDTDSDASAEQASKISLLRNMLMGLDFRTPNSEEIFGHLIFDHPYDQVRQSIARLLGTLIQSRISPSFESVPAMLEYNSNETGLGNITKRMPEFFDKAIRDLFCRIESSRSEIVGLSPQAILKTSYYYMSSTILYWITNIIRGPNKIILVPYIKEYIAPFLMNLEKLKDVCKLANIDPSGCYIALASLPLRKDQSSAMVSFLTATNLEGSHELRVQLGFVERMFSNQLLQLTEDEKNAILNFVVNNIYNENYVEVRIRAADVLSGIVHNLGEGEKLFELIRMFEKGLGNYSTNKRKKLSNTDTRVHGSIIGLGAIISAFPYVFPLPRWVPEQLSNLSSWARTNGVAGTAAKDTISEFKKVRADTWHLDRSTFTTEELEDLEGVLWRSYYA